MQTIILPHNQDIIKWNCFWNFSDDYIKYAKEYVKDKGIIHTVKSGKYFDDNKDRVSFIPFS